MPEPWTGRLVGKMHNNGVTLQDMADEMNCTKAYVSMILNSKKRPDNARERCESAFERIIARRKNDA